MWWSFSWDVRWNLNRGTMSRTVPSAKIKSEGTQQKCKQFGVSKVSRFCIAVYSCSKSLRPAGLLFFPLTGPVQRALTSSQAERAHLIGKVMTRLKIEHARRKAAFPLQYNGSSMVTGRAVVIRGLPVRAKVICTLSMQETSKGLFVFSSRSMTESWGYRGNMVDKYSDIYA